MTQQKKTALLVVTQDPDFKQMIQQLVNREPIIAAVSDGSSEAARFLLRNPLPDAVIIDLSMDEEQQPLEFLRQMRARLEFSKLPVLVLTAIPDPDQVKVALAAGANRYLTKLFASTNLITTVKSMLAEPKQPMRRTTSSLSTSSLGR
jgi:DNA-binding response OmpR family regulator